MATIEEFETALKEVVTAKRLSQSKMTSLTEIALKCMENDTQMVSILYRTHKGLSASGKTWSLYAFDALARAARHQVNKNHINGDSMKGNSATFLRKVEGVLDGLFHDMAATGIEDLKDKAKKILDIWTKSNTFPSAVLSPLYALLKQAENEKEPDMLNQSANPTPNPHAMPALPPNQTHQAPPPITPLATADIQATLLALLNKAASVAGTNGVASGQTPPNTVPPPAPAAPVMPVLDASQLAFLHQLAQSAKGAAPGPAQAQHPGVVQQQPVPASVVPTSSAVPVVPPSAHASVTGGTSQSQVYRDDHYGPPPTAREPEHYPPQYGGRYTPTGADAAGRASDPRTGGYSRGNDYGTPSHDRDAAVRTNVSPPPPPQPSSGYGYEEREAGRNPTPDRGAGYDARDFDDARDPRRDFYRDGPPPSYRGGPRERGGPGPGRGRGRGRWDDRRGPGGGDRDYHDGRGRDYHDDYRDRDRDFDDRDREGPRRRRDSRSWSPQGRRRGRGPYSPTRRRGPRDRDGRRQRDGDEDGGFRERYTYVPGRDGAQGGFDEFGRELRPSSPERERERASSDSLKVPNANTNTNQSQDQSQRRTDSPSASATASVTASDDGSATPEDVQMHAPGLGFTNGTHGHAPPTSEPSTSTLASPSPSASASSAPLPPASSSASAADVGDGGGGLNTFDRASFDPSQPASWAALGSAWTTTHGRAPSQEELMQFVFGTGVPTPEYGNEESPDGHGYGYGRGYGRGGRGGGFRGRGGGRFDDEGGYGGGRGRGYGYGRGRGGEYGARGRGDFEGGYSRGDYGPPRGGRGRGFGEHGGSGYAYDDPGKGGYGGGGRGGFGGRGGYGGRGGSGGGYGYGYGQGQYEDTDAVTLTGAGGGDDGSWQVPSGYEAPTSLPYGSEDAEQDGMDAENEDEGGGGGGGSTGKMQKVGDKWVFVRGAN